MNTMPGYEQLQDVLQAAMDQAAKGKGAERHANDLPFHEQRMQSISAMLDSDAGMAYQVCKKIAEARGMSHDARERELLGAIVYTAGMVIYHRERNAEQAKTVIEKIVDAGRKLDERVFAYGCLVCGKHGGHGGLPCPKMSATAGGQIPSSQDFDEERIDRIGQNGNEGEHYDAIEQTEKRQFKQMADQLDVPAKEPRRSPEPKPKAAPVVLPNTDALVDPTGRPSWSNVPNWVSWIGQDRNGVWTGFIAKPEPRAGRWFSTKRFVELNSGEALIGENWVLTLEERP
ncbi:hypothetical protein D3C78_654550 [compost metagenome]